MKFTQLRHHSFKALFSSDISHGWLISTNTVKKDSQMTGRNNMEKNVKKDRMQEAKEEKSGDGSRHRDKHKHGGTEHSRRKDDYGERKKPPVLKEVELKEEIGTLKERLSFLEKSMKKAKEKA